MSRDDDGITRLLLGESTSMRDLRTRIARVAKTGLAVLIEGPTGAGKELVAQALHGASARTGQCVAVNVCAVADGMFEDAFFGHARGAFTGATNDHAGYLTEAHRGTIFLDEIGGLSLGGQAKLLRAVETRQFRPVGARADQTSDFRVVAASNVSLDRLTHVGTFRRDLAERLRAVRLEVPALRDREGDSVLLASHFAERHGRVLSSRAQRVIGQCAWPGNVRQLRNVIDYAASLTEHTELIDEVILRECLGADELAADLPEHGRRAPGRTFRDRRMLAVLTDLHGDVDAAAAVLGVHRATVYRRLGRLRETGVVSVEELPKEAAATHVRPDVQVAKDRIHLTQ